MRRPLILAFAALALAAAPVRAGTNGIHLHQFALRCRSGSRTLAYVELQADSSGTTFDPSVGITLLNNAGATIYDFRSMFASQAGSGWSKGANWLVAGPTFKFLNAVTPDGPLNVQPDTLGGSIILFKLGADGVTRTTLDRVDYGLARGLPVPLGAAVTRQGDLSWMLDWQPKPRNLFGFFADVSTCFGDSVPLPQIRHFSLGCADGSATTTFLELTPKIKGIAFDAGVSLSLFDHAGNLLGSLARPFGSHTGATWGRNRSFVIAGPDFSARTGMVPDMLLPSAPDPLGGRIDLKATVNTTVSLQTLHYGDGFGSPVPGFGREVVWLSDSTYRNELTVSAADFSGDTLAAPSCFASFPPDSCPLCYPKPTYPTCPPIYAQWNDASDQGWFATAFVDRTFTRYGPEGNVRFETRHTRFDMSKGHLDADNDSGWGYPIYAEDEFVLVGPDVGATTTVTAGLSMTVTMGTSNPTGALSTVPTPFLDEVQTPLTTTRVSHTVVTVAKQIPVTVGTSFHLRYGHFGGGRIAISPGTDIQDDLHFLDIPAGHSIVSCYGFSQQGTAVVGTQVASASAAATPGRAELSWRVLQPASTALTVQRTHDGSGWIDLATALADGDGHVEYVDTSVQTGVRYGYRLRWSDTSTGMQTGGEVWAEIPAGYRFAMHRVSPNPSHGDVAINFEIAEPGAVRVELIDVAGRCVASRVLMSLAAGTHTVPITPTEALPPGVYMARIRAGAHIAQSRVIVIR